MDNPPAPAYPRWTLDFGAKKARATRPRAAGALVGALVLLACALVRAAPPSEDQKAYERESLADQLELDVTPVPPGFGAIFVPSLTDPELEPRVLVLAGKTRVAGGPTGRRLVLPPGRYTVLVGEGPLASRAEREVTVAEGVTMPLEPFFGALRVTAVTRRGKARSQAFVLGGPGGTYGPRETADELAYDATRTLLLPVGVYALALGEDPKADSSRFPVALGAGEILRYRLVVEDDSLLRAELADEMKLEVPSIWRKRWLIGGSFGFDRQERQLSSFNGDAVRIGAYMSADVGLDTGPHLALLNLEVDESWIAFEPTSGRGLPLQKLTDELGVELLYNYRLGRIFGPYVRAAGRTSFFDTNYFPAGEVTITTRDPSGATRTEVASRGDELTLFSSFHPLILQQGAGLALTVVDNETVTLIARGGVAARQTIFDGGRYVVAASPTQVTLLELEDSVDVGAEATAVFELRLGRLFSIGTRFESFLPQQQVFAGEPVRPAYRFANQAALRLGSFASPVYDLVVRRDDAQIENVQVSQRLSLRFQHTVL